MKPKGKTKDIVLTVAEIEMLIGKASSVIDTAEQYQIREILDEAMRKCQEIRNKFDPI